MLFDSLHVSVQSELENRPINEDPHTFITAPRLRLRISNTNQAITAHNQNVNDVMKCFKCKERIVAWYWSDETVMVVVIEYFR